LAIVFDGNFNTLRGIFTDRTWYILVSERGNRPDRQLCSDVEADVFCGQFGGQWVENVHGLGLVFTERHADIHFFNDFLVFV
jgi:hypothetical protein